MTTTNDSVHNEERPAGASLNSLNPAPGDPILFLDGHDYKGMIHTSLMWLERHIPTINALNVFPVPDGDTGTNMYLTMESAWKEISSQEDTALGPLAESVAHGALMGARGNSGVILSQILRGMAQALHEVERMDVHILAVALQQASATAYKAVIRPVEGTILTVARRVAEAGVLAAEATDDLSEAFGLIVDAAKRAVDETPSLLPVLADAGVVDAGGQGFCLILEGMLRHLRGEGAELEPAAIFDEIDLHHPTGPEEGYGYDVQFILRGENLDIDTIRADIDAMGQSTLVVGDSSTIKVHVHTPEPGTPLNYAVRLGSLSRVIVENLQEQYEEFRAGQPAPAASPVLPRVSPPPTSLSSEIGIVAVVPGDGFARVFKSLGTSAIVPGGQTMNPSIEDILKAIEGLNHKNIIILPNNKNVILTAQQVQALTARPIRVIPTKTVPQGISTLLAFNYQADVDTNVQLMEEAMETVHSGEITRAVRSVKINGLEVEEGDFIGILDGELVAAGDDMEEVMLKLLKTMDAAELEIITLYYGEGVSQEEAELMADTINQQYPEQEIEVIEGGQPYYPYIISGE